MRLADPGGELYCTGVRLFRSIALEDGRNKRRRERITGSDGVNDRYLWRIDVEDETFRAIYFAVGCASGINEIPKTELFDKGRNPVQRHQLQHDGKFIFVQFEDVCPKERRLDDSPVKIVLPEVDVKYLQRTVGNCVYNLKDRSPGRLRPLGKAAPADGIGPGSQLENFRCCLEDIPCDIL